MYGTPADRVDTDIALAINTRCRKANFKVSKKSIVSYYALIYDKSFEIFNAKVAHLHHILILLQPKCTLSLCLLMNTKSQEPTKSEFLWVHRKKLALHLMVPGALAF